MSHSDSPAAETLEGFELAPQQQRLLRWHEGLLQQPAPRAQLCLRLPDSTSSTQLRHSLLSVIERHEILRTRYRRLPGMRDPLQVIEAAPALYWQMLAREAPSAQLGLDDDIVCVDLQRGQNALHVRLRLPAAHADSASLLQLAGEWCAAYGGTVDTEPGTQYADYAAWRAELAGNGDEEHSFWSRELGQRVVGLKLPLRAVVAYPEGTRSVERLPVPLDAAEQTRVVALARQQQCDPALLALTAWLALLHQHSEADQLTLGLDWQSRDAQLSRTLGLLSEPLPLTVRGLASVSARSLTSAVAAQVASLEAHRDTFPSLLDEQPALAGFRYVPAADAVLDAVLMEAGWHVEAAEGATSPHVLSLSYQQEPNGFSLQLHYDATLYDTASAGVLADQLATLLTSLVRPTDARLGELSALSAQERAAALGPIPASDPLSLESERAYERVIGYPHLAACFGEQIRDASQRPAVADARRSLSYAQLDAESARIGQALIAAGAKPGTRVIHFMPRGVDAISAMVGILRAGGVYVPIDPHYPEERITYLLQDSGAELVVTQRELAHKLLAGAPRVVFTDERSEPQPWPSIGPRAPAYLIYTSGSTGRPRGVVISHANALYSLAARVSYYPDPIGRFLLLSSFAFDSSIAGLFGTLAQGGCVYVCSEAEQKDPDRLADIVCDQQITHLLALPSLYHLLLPRLAKRSHALVAAIVAGEACPTTLLGEHQRLVPGARLYNEYGATEASVWSTVAECVRPTSGEAIDALNTARPVTIGRPIPHSRVYVLDANGEPVARGLKGEISVAGPGLSDGYLGHPDLTAQKFVTLRDERLYRTGDFGYWDERRELVFLGRADSQIKLRGYRIELGEVESALRRVTGLEQVAVLTDRREDGDLFLRGFVESERELEPAPIRAALTKLIPEPMIPADIQSLARFPQTANGKLDRRALLELRRRGVRRPYVAAATLSELALQAIWRELLGGEAPGRDDDFFALGGHSLLAVRLVHRIEASLGCALPVNRVFEHPTLAALAAQLEGAQETDELGAVIALNASTSAHPGLFCIDPSGVHAEAYAELAQALTPNVRVWALPLGPALALEGPAVAGVAQRLADTLRRQQPQGPYRLLGWSLGGALALAVVHVLERDGAVVSFLGVLDAQPPVHLYAAGDPDPLEELAVYVDRDRQADLRSLPDSERAALRAKLAVLSADQRAFEAIAWAQRQGFIRDEGPSDALAQRHALLSGVARQLATLPPQALSAPIHVWWTEETLRFYGEAPVDWQRYTRAAVTEARVAGDHAAPLHAADVHLALLRHLEVS